MANPKNQAKIQFIAETSEFTEQIKKANQSMSELRSELRLSEEQFRGNENSVEALTAKKRILQQQLETSAQKVEALRQKLEKAKAIYGENSDEVSKLKTQLNNAERQYVQTENAIEDVNHDLNSQEKETEEATDATNGLTAAMDKANNGFTVMKGVIADLVADGIRMLIDGLKEASKYMLTTGMDYEYQMSQVQAISGATTDELEQLNEKAKEMGAITKFSASESAEAFTFMAQAGWQTEQMLDGIEGVMNLAAAGGADLATSAEIVTTGLTAMGYAAGDAGRLADVMAVAAAASSTDVEKMGYTFKYAAPIAGTFGYTMEDLAVAMGVMANNSITAETAGTQLRAGMLRMTKPTDEMATAMEKYGLSITNSDGSMKSLMEVMTMYREKLGGLTAAEQAKTAATLFGTEAASGWLAIINSSPEDFDKMTQAIYNSEGAAKEMAEMMQNNLKSDVEQLGGAIETVALNIYGEFSPALRSGVQALTDFISGGISMTEMFAKLGQAVSSIGETIKGYMPTLASVGKELIINLANGLVSGIPTLVTKAANIVTSIADGIANNAQKILEMGGKLVVGLGESIVAAVPKLITSAANIVKSLASGITSNAQTFVSKALDLLNGFADSLTSSVPTLVKNGMEFIRNLVKGLVNSLPELISRAPEIISKFANVINDNAPTIIAAGIGIIKDLIVGLIKAIPTLIANIPKIITAIVDVWQAFNWADLGKKAITWLKDGIIKTIGLVKTAGTKVLTTITDALKSLPSKLLDLGKQGVNGIISGIKGLLGSLKNAAVSIFNAVWDGVKSLPSKLLGLGKDLVKGLWNGISDMTSWVIDKIKGFGESVLNGIKRFFGIASPSKVMRDQVGRYLAEGVGAGIEENEDAAIEPMQGIVDKIKGVDVAGEWGKLSGVGGSLNYDVSAQLGDYVASAIDSNSPYAILSSLIDAVEDLANRAIVLDVDGQRFAEVIASASDNVSGNRMNLRSRGLALG